MLWVLLCFFKNNLYLGTSMTCGTEGDGGLERKEERKQSALYLLLWEESVW